MDKKPNDLTKFSSNQAIKVINAIANITPGIAQPDIDNMDKAFSVLFFETLLQ